MKRILILGLGRATKNLIKFLLSEGAELYAYEEKPMATIDPEINKLMEQGQIKKLVQIDNFDQVITSPGFDEKKEIIIELKNRGLALVDEIEFTYQYVKNNIIAVTGTNGKSTTAALISHILKTAGHNCFLGGNIAPGKPFSAALLEPPYDYYTLEVSTFQLERINKFKPAIAVLTNITADHLDRHTSIDVYRQLKLKIFINQGTTDYAVLNYDDEITRREQHKINSKKLFFSKIDQSTDVFYQTGEIVFHNRSIIADSEIPLPGLHNIENVMAAIGVAKIIDIENPIIRQAVMSFKGLPHRLEFVEKIRGITFINNSMCTNPSAAIASISAIPGSKIVILGGKEKGFNNTDYLDAVINKARASIIMGENKEKIAAYFKSKGYNSFTLVKDMSQAVKEAFKLARIGDTVLLNPGYTSFGDFKDFEERGEVFKNAVRKAR